MLCCVLKTARNNIVEIRHPNSKAGADKVVHVSTVEYTNPDFIRVGGIADFDVIVSRRREVFICVAVNAAVDVVRFGLTS